MSSWTPAADRPGYLCKTVQRGPCTIHIYRPLTDAATQAKNEQKAKTALENALREHYKRGT